MSDFASPAPAGPAFDRSKFVEALLFVAWQLRDDPHGGAIKLNKVLHFAELGHMRRYHRPITGARYQKLQMGPAPRALVPVREELVASGRAELVRDHFLGQRMDRLIPSHEPEIRHLDGSEIESLEQALLLLAGRNGTEASEISHEEPGWQLVEIGEDIPFESAYLAPPVVTPAIRRKVAEIAASPRHAS
jgi:hypothetical protein